MILGRGLDGESWGSRAGHPRLFRCDDGVGGGSVGWEASGKVTRAIGWQTIWMVKTPQGEGLRGFRWEESCSLSRWRLPFFGLRKAWWSIDSSEVDALTGTVS